MVGWLGHLSPHSKKINITQQQKQEKKNKRKKNQKRTTKNNRKTPIFTLLLQGIRSTQWSMESRDFEIIYVIYYNWSEKDRQEEKFKNNRTLV